MREVEEIVRTSRILIVDDEVANVRVLERMLEQAGYGGVIGTTDPIHALELFRELQPDLVLLDLHMPGIDGLELMRRIHDEIPPESYLPIVVITADLAPEMKLRSLLLGAKDFLTKPIDRLETMLRVQILLHTRIQFRRLEQEVARLRGRSS